MRILQKDKAFTALDTRIWLQTVFPSVQIGGTSTKLKEVDRVSIFKSGGFFGDRILKLEINVSGVRSGNNFS